MNVLGMMSGTSMDGIDAVLVKLHGVAGSTEGLVWEVLARASLPYEPALRARLARALSPAASDVLLLTELHAEVGEAYAALASRVIARHPVDLVAMAGQTVYHVPRVDRAQGWRVKSTLQLGEATRVVERCALPVACDFRQSDMSAGGQGAPMVAFGDLALFHRSGVARAVHNLGGISNLTYLPADGARDGVVAFDTGPASCIIDEAMERLFDRPLDQDGTVAARGAVDREALAKLLRHPYLELAPPKTTGREVFHYDEALRRGDLGRLDREDVVATLTAFTAETIARAYRAHVIPRGLDEILLAGGGAYNPTMVRMIRERLADVPVSIRTFEEAGYVAKDREALAFAVMAYEAWHGRTNTLPSATGARHAVIAGKIALPPPTAG